MIDCSKTLNYVAEQLRMCESYRDENYDCDERCPLAMFACGHVDSITQDRIDIVQKWSDEHPPKTLADRFFEIFPYAPKDEDGLPRELCLIDLGWVNECNFGGACIECWNRPYKE